MVRVVGDVLKAFAVDIDGHDEESFSALDETTQQQLVTDALQLRRFGREEGVRIDAVENA